MVRMFAMVLCALFAAPTMAQDESAGPCDKPTDKDIVKLLEAAAKSKDKESVLMLVKREGSSRFVIVKPSGD